MLSPLVRFPPPSLPLPVLYSLPQITRITPWTTATTHPKDPESQFPSMTSYFRKAASETVLEVPGEDETVRQTVQQMLEMTLEDRRAYIDTRLDQLRIVPIRRHADAAGDVTNRLMASLDYRRPVSVVHHILVYSKYWYIVYRAI